NKMRFSGGQQRKILFRVYIKNKILKSCTDIGKLNFAKIIPVVVLRKNKSFVVAENRIEDFLFRKLCLKLIIIDRGFKNCEGILAHRIDDERILSFYSV